MTRKEIVKLSYTVTGCAIKVHKVLGPGLLESIYEKCLRYELEKNGYEVKQQMSVSVIYDGLVIDCPLKVDLFVNDLIVIELKTVDALLPIHEAQLITYMNLLHCPQGLLINFNTISITNSMRPLINKRYQFSD